MSKLSLQKIMELAKQLGIEIEKDSDNPGFFIEDDEGNGKEVTIEEILLIKPDSDDEDEFKKIELKGTQLRKNHNIEVDDKLMLYKTFLDVKGVA